MAKMDRIAACAHIVLDSQIPFLKITCSDALMSSVTISGSFDERDTWENRIYENSRHFRFMITPEGRKQFYDEADQKVTVELFQCCYKIKGKFRKYTGTHTTCLAKVLQWIFNNQGQESE